MSTPAKKNSSFSTILAMLNNMLGGALLSFPIFFKDKGILSCTLVVCLSAVIAFVTCRIYVLHSKPEEKTIQETILRINGKKWVNIFSFISGVYIVFLNFISIDLIVDQLYSIIYLIFDFTGSASSIAQKDTIDFTQFSVQWLTLLLFIPLLVLSSMKDINMMVNFSKYGAGAIFVYMIYVLIQFFVSAGQGNIDMSHISWFSIDVAALAGTCSLGFTIHTTVSTFTKENQKQENNGRDLGITYSIACLTYLTVSVAGAFAISDKKCTNTLVDCYLADWTILFVEITYLLGRVGALPIMVQISRSRLLNLLGQVSDKNFKIYNIFFMVLASIVSILSPILPLSTLMSIVGAVVCYFFIYFFPTKLHYGCLYPKARKQQSLLQTTASIQQSQHSKIDVAACNHSEDYVHKTPKWVRNMTHGTLNIIGLAIGVFGLYSSLKQIVDNDIK